MNANDEMQTFLRDGYKHYVDAKDSVTTFEKEIQEQLMRQLEAKLDWTNFHATRGERGRSNAVHAGLWPDAGRPAIWAQNNDDDDDNGSIELGIRWGKHKTGRPYLYTSRWGTRARKLNLSDPESPVQNHEGHLIVVVDDGFELEPMARLLLRETDRALAGVKPVT